jgi:hypothetical protein
MAYQGNDASRIVVGANGTVFVSDTSATAPTDATTDLMPVAPHDAGAGDWVELGFVSENGVQIIPSQTIAPIMAWQSSYSVRKIVTARGLELDFVLREFNAETIPFAFGGGMLEEAAGEKFTYTPPEPQEIDLRSLVVDWADGDRDYRLYIPNGQVTDLAQFTLSRTAPAELPIKFELNHSGSGAPWKLFSDDAGLEGS